jgi:colanic acid/amylovoran biosynthesis glycosyltransferase
VQLRQLYAQADIFLLASVTAADGDMEGQGIVLQEAQASSVPIISTWHNGIPEGVLVDESAFLVPERDVEALTDRLAYLVTHADQRRRMGKTGQVFVGQHFSIAVLTEQLLSIYQRLI